MSATTGSDILQQSSQSVLASNPEPHLRGIGALSAYTPFIQATQIIVLGQDGVIDENATNAILRAVDASMLSQTNINGTVWEMAAALDDRLDATLPAGISGGSALGRTRGETIATSLRMIWREDVATIAQAALDLRSAALELASVHSVTVMGLFADRKAAAPSTLTHFLGGLIGPLESTWERSFAALNHFDRSPFGYGMMVGEVFGADRERTASMLGFHGPITNTLDASASVEDIIEVVEAMAAQVAVIRRFINELLVWIRTDATSFFIDERWETLPEPTHPAHTVSSQLEELNLAAMQTELHIRSLVDMLRSQPYGPIGTNWNTLAPMVDEALRRSLDTIVSARAAIREAVIVNRAYLANRAGRLYSTASDLAAFLMDDQQIPPAHASRIAGLAIQRLKEANREISQITPDVIDSGAMMVLGQELKVELETLGRYIAPRRYIERRDVLGSPKSDRAKEWLQIVDHRIVEHREQLNVYTQQWSDAHDQIRARLAESAQTSEN